MHRRIHKRMVITAMVSAAALLALATGCAGGSKGLEEDLVRLETGSEEVPEEGADQEDQTGQEECFGRDSQEVQGTKEESQGILEKDAKSSQDSGIVYVHVCGEVASPGVYPLAAGSRLYEAIEAAGGILENAAGDQMNQAARIEDGQQIYVPSREEVQQGITGGAQMPQQTVAGGGNTGQKTTAGNQSSSSEDGKVDLNTASREQLMTLSGIGEAKAASIIAYREEHGGFRKIEELMEVEGIKEGVFNKVRDQIRID